jgi:HEPN domain-containing protein
MEAFTKASFEAAMREIDEALRSREIDISDRFFGAIAEFVKRYHLQIPLRASPLSSDTPYTPEFLVAHIGAWYERLHGERLVTRSLSIGRMALLIRNDLWVVRFPVIVGGPFSWVACNRHAIEEHSLDNDQYNIFQSFDGMSAAYWADLSPAELEVVLKLFSLGERALCSLSRVARTDLIHAARADHDAAVEHLAAPHPHSGLSRWASLQAVEKLLKAFLSSQQDSFPPSHNLATLTSRAVEAGLSPPSPEAIAQVQCEPGVRYGEERVSRADAVLAHHAALRATEVIAPQLPSKGA